MLSSYTGFIAKSNTVTLTLMTIIPRILAGVLCFGAIAGAQTAPTISSMVDGAIRTAERELVPLVEAMPDAKMGFAPTAGEFTGVRTFAQQATHIGYVLYAVSAAALGEKNPSTSGPEENGPADVKTKEQVVKYLKDAFAYAHKAAQALTAQNAADLMPSPFGSGKMPRLSALQVASWHSFDHYGQMAVYARMNGIIPPASRQ